MKPTPDDTYITTGLPGPVPVSPARRSLLVIMSGLLGVTAGRVPRTATAADYATLLDARWKPAPGDIALTADRHTARTELPRPSDIHTDLLLRAELTFSQGKLHPGTRATIVAPASARDAVRCQYAGGRELGCVARRGWVRSLRDVTTVEIRIEGLNRSSATLRWVLHALP